MNAYKNLHPNVWLLMFAQSLLGSIGPVIVFVGGFIGIKIAPTPVLATLPVACMVIGIALFLLPTVKLLAKVGRKKGFLIAIFLGVLNSLFAAYTILIAEFWLFCLSILFYGITIASAQQYRFAAMESVDDSKAGSAVSALLIAGLIAAFIGPEVAFQGKDLFDTEFVGSFVGVSVLMLFAALFILLYKNIDKHVDHHIETVRPLKDIARQPVFIASVVSAAVGFSVMSFIMTATPISMHVFNGFDMAETKWVIQSHIVAMYLPSFFTGILIQKFGKANVLYTGVAIFAVCLAVGFAGQHYIHFFGALVLLGIGWNFMFVTATTMLPECYEPSEKFKVQGFNDFMIFSFQAIASLSAGLVINLLGWNMMLVICIPPLLISAFFIFRWQQRV